MSLLDLLFSLDGRIGRAKFWVGVLILMLVSIFAMYAILAVAGVSQAAVAFSAAVGFALAYPSYAVMAKRFQDRNKPGSMALLVLVPAYGVNLLYTLHVFDPVDPTALAQICDVLVVLLTFWVLIELGCLKGTQGPNLYGPDPLGATQADATLG